MRGNAKAIINWLLDQDQNKTYECREEKKKRTLSQNAYYFTLLNKLSKKLKIPSTELHFELIKKSCPFEEYLVPKESNLRSLEYFEERNTIEKNGKEFKVIRVYVGSSLLDTSEMGILLDNLIDECKLQGIETLPPYELEKMRSLERSK